MLLDNIKQFAEEISKVELNHLDPIRVRIFLSGLIEEEEMSMSRYTTGVIPSLVKELNDLSLSFASCTSSKHLSVEKQFGQVIFNSAILCLFQFW